MKIKPTTDQDMIRDRTLQLRCLKQTLKQGIKDMSIELVLQKVRKQKQIHDFTMKAIPDQKGHTTTIKKVQPVCITD